jgi:N-dimethylarginine dimethylaminohydrolase
VSKVIENRNQLTLLPQQVPTMPEPQRILLADPAYFSVDRPINAHMFDAEGNTHKLDKNLAREQWTQLKKVYNDLGYLTYVLNPVPQLPDFVFCANTFLPYVDVAQKRHGILSRMFDPIRRKEVPHAQEFFIQQGYIPHEAGGDALWVPGRRFLLGGYGFRTSRAAYPVLSAQLDVPIAIFHLTNPLFYHLDTCLVMLNDTTALACPEAFSAESWLLLEQLFPNLWEIPLKEADAPGFACNPHSPDGQHVILQKGNHKTYKILEKGGFIPVEVDTSEFVKSGGSVSCMKCPFW